MSHKYNYLSNLMLKSVPVLTPGVLVIGSGVAGLSAAIAAAEEGTDVLLVTKDSLRESNTFFAQGGIAVAMAPEDSIELHLKDTLNAGGGLCDEDAVRVLVREGVDRCRELLDWGLPFDTKNGAIAFTMEGAHCVRRVVHADGDATGRVMANTMIKRVLDHPRIQIFENHFVIDLLHKDGVCHGAVILDCSYGRLIRAEATATVIASGGLGMLYRESTNPEVATGDGYALGFRAGTTLRDMEFVQFHPTTLYLPGAPRFLISESVRGEGAHLLNLSGERFMSKYSPDAELAPRDIVSQSIFMETNATGTTHVLLDLRHIDKDLINLRFPNIRSICSDYGIDIYSEPIPVRPAVHYMMGGIKVDINGKTSVHRLLAAGEVASTGVHGANRLASNSLLEGLVFGYRAGKEAAAYEAGSRYPADRIGDKENVKMVRLDIADVIRSLKALTWRHLGVFREDKMLREAETAIDSWMRYILPENFQASGGFEVQNMLMIAKVIAHSALLRTESRGAHQRIDFPNTDPAWARHSEISKLDFS